MEIVKHGRHFAVEDGRGDVLAVCLYRKGAVAVLDTVSHLTRRAEALEAEIARLTAELLLATARKPEQQSLFAAERNGE